MPRRRIMRTYNFLIAFVVLLLDRYTKRVVATHITLHDSITVIQRILHVRQQAAASGGK